MEKNYNPQQIEQKWYASWEEAKYFSPSGKGEPYCIAIPPPNVTGSLHMGHGFQLSIMDALIRYKRMQGCNTLWQVGTDHAGIATQIVVERKLEQEGLSRNLLGRESFVNKIWEWKKLSGDTIYQQQRRMGISTDWQRERFTMDPTFVEAVHHVFISLYEEGLIYRGKKLVNWDPTLNTAISDLEVISEETDGQLWYIKYPRFDNNEYVIVATTRPETIFGDVAIAVNPNDERYQHIIGKQVHVPLVNRLIPIIADDTVIPEFGTGCVKITPAHDFNDYATGQRHNLPQISIFTANAILNDNTPENYRGLDRFVARQRIIAELTILNFLEKTEPYRINVPRGDRSGSIIEPYLTDQWFVKTKELAGPAMEAVTSGQIKFYPDNWSKVYLQWLENIEDWCISRQLWWGHRIPAWYDANGNIYVGRSIEDVRKKFKLAEDITLTQDEDVLDTWFSSALWPFVTLGWPQDTKELQTFYPTNVLVTAFDIIFFWVARMVMMGLKFTKKVPFREVYITGLIRDSKGKKMSKSKGNIIDPVDLIDGISLENLIAKRTSNLMQPQLVQSIEKNTRLDFPQGISAFGTDALRFTFCALASTGRDINFDFGRLEGYRNFCTKLWNAARFVLMQFQAVPLLQHNEKNNIQLGIADRWIRTKLHLTIKEVTEHFKDYRFDLVAQSMYDFIWHEYCDWYVELCKPILATDYINPALKNGARKTLVSILEAALRLIHPLMPFISEEIWQQITPYLGIKPTTIMLQQYPIYDEKVIDQNAVHEIEWLKKVVVAIRNIRGEMNIAPKKLLQLKLNKGSELDKKYLEQNRLYLLNLARLESIDWVTNGKLSFSATAVIDDLELHIPMENIIDKNAEIWRLNKEINKLKIDHERVSYKLKNQAYLDKAPAELVAKEQQRLNEIQNTLIKLQQNLTSVEKM